VASGSPAAYAGPFARARWCVDGRDSLSQLIRDYKRITAKLANIEWQRNFFDHRLRHDESLTERFAYICQNPAAPG
jgi:hypothetical protein